MPEQKLHFVREEILAAAEAIFLERYPNWKFSEGDSWAIRYAEVALQAVEKMNNEPMS